MSELPLEVWARVFDYVNSVSLLACSCVCIDFKDLLLEDKYWKHQYERFTDDVESFWGANHLTMPGNGDPLWMSPNVTIKSKCITLSRMTFIHADNKEGDSTKDRAFCDLLDNLGTFERSLVKRGQLLGLRDLWAHQAFPADKPTVVVVICREQGPFELSTDSKALNLTKPLHILFPEPKGKLPVLNGNFTWSLPTAPSTALAPIASTASFRNVSFNATKISGTSGQLRLHYCTFQAGLSIKARETGTFAALHTRFVQNSKLTTSDGGKFDFDECVLPYGADIKVGTAGNLRINFSVIGSSLKVSQDHNQLFIEDSESEGYIPTKSDSSPSILDTVFGRLRKHEKDPVQFGAYLHTVSFLWQRLRKVDQTKPRLDAALEGIKYGFANYNTNQIVVRACCKLIPFVGENLSKLTEIITSEIFGMMRRFKDEKKVVSDGILALYALCDDMSVSNKTRACTWRTASSKSEYIQLLVSIVRKYAKATALCKNIIIFLWMLGDGSGRESIKARESIFVNGGAEIFVELIEHGELEVVSLVLDALVNINISETNRRLFVEKGGVRAIQTSLKSTDPQMLKSLTQFLRSFFYSNDNIAPEFDTQGVVGELIKIISDPDVVVSVKEQASAALANYASCSESNKESLIKQGAMLPLLKLLQHARLLSDNTRIMMGTIVALCHLSSKVALSPDYLVEIERYWTNETQLNEVIFSPNDVKFVLHSTSPAVLMMGLWCIAVISLEEPIASSQIKWKDIAKSMEPFLVKLSKEAPDGSNKRKRELAEKALKKLHQFKIRLNIQFPKPPQSGGDK